MNTLLKAAIIKISLYSFYSYFTKSTLLLLNASFILQLFSTQQGTLQLIILTATKNEDGYHGTTTKKLISVAMLNTFLRTAKQVVSIKCALL